MDERRAVELLRRLEVALPDIGLNGWAAGVEAVQYAIATIERERWRPIAEAPKDGEIVLVNDTTGLTRWCAAKWLEGQEWQGWMYDDEISNDSNPCGPEPTHWRPLPDPQPDGQEG